MRIVQINSCINGSTGKIMREIQGYAQETGHQYYIATKRDFSTRKFPKQQHVYIGNILDKRLHGWLAYKTGNEGGYSKYATLKFILWIEKFQPDIIHLHNLHPNYINLELLFNYLKQKKIQAVWTLHDCWSFTGGCPHFEIAECNKWKTQCSNCTQYQDYPSCEIDNSKKMFIKKKQLFAGLQNMTIVTPSLWLQRLVQQSFLKEYPVYTIHNGVDLNIFKPAENSFKEKYDLQGKFVLLGVSFGWGIRKGLEIINDLADELDERFKIVLAGVGEAAANKVHRKILCIEKTENQRQLAEIYAGSDLFINPTLEDNYPTVNIEAIACGLPVLTFDTGGCGECINDSCGFVVKRNDYASFLGAIYAMYENNMDKSGVLENRERISSVHMCQKYVSLYEELLKNSRRV